VVTGDCTGLYGQQRAAAIETGDGSMALLEREMRVVVWEGGAWKATQSGARENATGAVDCCCCCCVESLPCVCLRRLFFCLDQFKMPNRTETC
jgi:hypothetical protein